MRLKYGSYENATFEDLKGRTMIAAVQDGEYNDSILFTMDNGERYMLTHQQECCEDVHIESIVGDLQDLVGSPITMAELVTENQSDERYDDSTTWSFYKLATEKGYVDIRWIGSSNGYYSEEVDFVRLK